MKTLTTNGARAYVLSCLATELGEAAKGNYDWVFEAPGAPIEDLDEPSSRRVVKACEWLRDKFKREVAKRNDLEERRLAKARR